MCRLPIVDPKHMWWGPMPTDDTLFPFSFLYGLSEFASILSPMHPRRLLFKKKNNAHVDLEPDDDSDDWEVSVTDFKDCPIGMPFPEYLGFRIEQGIPRNVTLKEWEEIDIEKERDEMAKFCGWDESDGANLNCDD
jgi:hypothetical protein